MQDQENKKKRVVVLGAGFGGLTFCQTLECPYAHITLVDRHVLKRDFRRIDSRQTRVILVEAGPHLLPQFSPRLSAKAAARLAAMGVEVRTNALVEDIGRNHLQLADGNRIDSANIVWAAGVAANSLTRELGVELDRAGRICVNPDLSVPGHPEVFAIGDIALVLDENGGQVPGVSPAAMQMGRHVARLINQACRSGTISSSSRPEFKYWNKGTMATIGRSAAVAQVGRLEFSGWPAWVAWLLVHLIFLIGFRSKVVVLLHWIFSYVTYKLGSRIVFGLEDSEATIEVTIDSQHDSLTSASKPFAEEGPHDSTPTSTLK